MPARPPRHRHGIPCTLCANACRIGPGEQGYCGLREHRDGRLHAVATATHGLLHAYRDPMVTNCCAAWFCPGGTGCGYPRYAYRDGPETGYSNLAVFFYGCNFDCLFCQNASHRDRGRVRPVSLDALAARVAPDVSCVCFFGGSPELQLPFALAAARRIRAEHAHRPLRICFEWNGCGDPRLVRDAADLAAASGGNAKFDLKCASPALSLALSGVANQRAFANFRRVAEAHPASRRMPPVLSAATLLVPGYVDAGEVAAIAGFIADLDDAIPYSLLVFAPHDRMADLPVTPRRQVEACYRVAARRLRRVHVGNLHLLAAAEAQYTLK